MWSVYFQSDHILYLSWGMDWPIVLYQIIALHFFSVQNIHHIRHTRQKCSVRVPIRPFTTSSALLFTFPLFDVETTWGILNDISITPASDMRLVYILSFDNAKKLRIRTLTSNDKINLSTIFKGSKNFNAKI